jgi:ribonuclease VapC
MDVGVSDAKGQLTDLVRRAEALCAAAYRQWGRKNHPANLNVGDCFAYTLAKSPNCPLLFVGDDFSRTDITRALPDAASTDAPSHHG